MMRTSEVLANFIVNASWQILVILAVASIGAQFLRNASAKYRHALWLATLVLSVFVPIWSVTRFSPGLAPRDSSPFSLNKEALRDARATPAGPEIDGADSPATFERLLVRRAQVVTTAPQTLVLLSSGYLLFILLRVIRLVRLWRRKKKLSQTAHTIEMTPAVARMARGCAQALYLKPVPVVCSPMTLVPVTLGTWDPVIVLPEHFCSELDEETLLSVIGHEMAHVSRRDFVVNLICELISLPISFHPLTYMIKRHIHRTRELACDEVVTRHVLPAQAYARSLVRVANATIRPRAEAFMLSIFDGNILEERIMKLTRKQRQLGLRTCRAIVVTVLSLLSMVALSISTLSVDLQAFTVYPTAQPVEFETVVAASPATTSQPPVVRSVVGPPRSEQTPSIQGGAQERAQAACDAAQKGSVEAIPNLISMLGDDSKTELVKCWENGRWSPALDTFKHPSPGEQAALALASMGPPAFEPLANQLDNSSATVRRNAAWAIGELTRMTTGSRSSAVPQLISLLGDSDHWVRMAAARALGELRDERAGEKLITLLSDAEWRVRELAAWALSEMKDTRAVKALCNVLLSDAQVEVRRSAAEALGEIRSSEALPALNQALNDPEARVRARVHWAIAEIEDSDG